MGTVAASAIIAQASELAQDVDNVTWTLPQALAWVNDGQRAVALVRPDASVNVHSVRLTSGTRQTLTGRRLMAIHRNTGVDGNTPGRAIVMTDMATKDEFEPDWHTDTANTVVKECMYDPKTPKIFWVSPPVHATTAVYAEISEAVNPTDCATTDSLIDLDDIYVPALIEWEMYRFFARDSEQTPNHIRAAGHFKNFFNLLGAKMQADMAVSAKVKQLAGA